MSRRKLNGNTATNKINSNVSFDLIIDLELNEKSLHRFVKSIQTSK